MEMKNKYETNGEVTKIFVESSKGETLETIIDTEDLDLVKWGTNWKVNEQGYVYGSVYGNVVQLHRLVMEALTQFNKEIDHIKHDTLDNRKSQLRLVTKSENQQNRLV